MIDLLFGRMQGSSSKYERIILIVWEDHPHSMGAHRADPPDQTRSALQCNGELTGYCPENYKQRSFFILLCVSPEGQVKGTFEP